MLSIIHSPAKCATAFGTGAEAGPYILFANVGQGDCQLIQCSSQFFVLIDCGSTSQPEVESGSESAADNTRAPVVQGIRELIKGDNKEIYVAITHADSDHYNLLDSILFDDPGSEPVAKIVNVFLGGESTGNLGAAPKLKSFLSSNSTLVADKFNPECGNNVVFYELANNTATKSAGSSAGIKKNTAGLVVAVSFEKITTILSADATGDTESAVVEKFKLMPENNNIRILTMSHHGSNSNGSNTLLPDAYKPEIFVVSGKPTGGHRFPNTEAVEMVQASTYTKKDDDTIQLSGNATITTGKRKRGTLSMAQGDGSSPVLGTADYGSMWFYCNNSFPRKLEVGCTRDQCPKFTGNTRCGNEEEPPAKRIRTRSQGPPEKIQ